MLPPESTGTSGEEARRGAEQDVTRVFLVVVPQQWPPDERRHALREHPSRHVLRTQIRALCGTSVIVPFPTVSQQQEESTASAVAASVIGCAHCAAEVREHGYRCVLLESG